MRYGGYERKAASVCRFVASVCFLKKKRKKEALTKVLSPVDVPEVSWHRQEPDTMAQLEDYTRDHVAVTEGGGALDPGCSSTVIKLDKRAYAAVDESEEILLAVAKRFKGKKTAYVAPSYQDLLKWCLASDSYKVCEENVAEVSNRNVEAVWEFIDTMSVSSTRSSRETIGTFKDSRSAVGFRRALHRSAPRSSSGSTEQSSRSVHSSVQHSRYPVYAVRHTQVSGDSTDYTARAPRFPTGTRFPLLPRNAVPPILCTTPADQDEGHESLADLLADECAQWISSSADPCATALNFREQLLQFD